MFNIYIYIFCINNFLTYLSYPAKSMQTHTQCWSGIGVSFVHRLNGAMSFVTFYLLSIAKQEQFHSNRWRTTAGRPCPDGGRKRRGKSRGIKSRRAAPPSPTGIKESRDAQRAPRSSSPRQVSAVTSNGERRRGERVELAETWEPPVTISILSSSRPTASTPLALAEPGAPLVAKGVT